MEDPMNIIAMLRGNSMKNILFTFLAFAAAGCADQRNIGSHEEKVSFSNPAINELYLKSRKFIVDNAKISQDTLDKKYHPEYVLTKNEICIAWFPVREENSLDDRKTHVTCLDNDASISDKLSYNSYRE
jgi:hypothetical protein